MAALLISALCLLILFVLLYECYQTLLAYLRAT